ncbi:MAG: hypothetical protein ABI143_07810 [Caldimonas sp.]
MNGLRLMVTSLVLGVALAGPAALAAPPSEVHGSLDAFAAPGVALAWAVLRGKDEASAEVVVEVVADPATYRSLSVVGVDPFSKSTSPLLATTPIDGPLLVRVPRVRFADLPRTEWRLYASSASDASLAPAIVIYFQGVPDTTPEFNDEAALLTSLTQRVERARRELKIK